MSQEIKLRASELKERLSAQNIFNQTDYQNSPFEPVVSNLSNFNDQKIYLELLESLDLHGLKNVSRYVEIQFKSKNNFPNQVTDVYDLDHLRELISDRWVSLINKSKENTWKLFKGIEDYFLPPKIKDVKI